MNDATATIISAPPGWWMWGVSVTMFSEQRTEQYVRELAHEDREPVIAFACNKASKETLDLVLLPLTIGDNSNYHEDDEWLFVAWNDAVPHLHIFASSTRRGMKILAGGPGPLGGSWRDVIKQGEKMYRELQTKEPKPDPFRPL